MRFLSASIYREIMRFLVYLAEKESHLSGVSVAFLGVIPAQIEGGLSIVSIY